MSNSGRIFVIGDTHFFHKNIIRYCDRPDNFEKIIIENWNNQVKPDDYVIHLGDLSAGLRGRQNELKEIVKNLNGKKALVIGNHDHLSEKEYRDMGFEKISEYMILQDILFTHYPLEFNDYQKPKEIEKINNLIKIFEDNKIKYVIHGHIHNRKVSSPDHFNCSVECIDYTPKELSKVIEIIDEQIKNVI